MRTVDNFSDYELIDADAGERLERWGDVILIRPDPQVIWNNEKMTAGGKLRRRYITGLIPAADIGRNLKMSRMCGQLITKTLHST